MNLKYAILLARPKHYLKNGLIFLPLVFSGQLFTSDFYQVLWAAVAFSLLTSVVYIFNDIRDYREDKLHPKKKLRPIASGKITIRQAQFLMLALTLAALIVGYISNLSLYSWIIAGIYVCMNIGYSLGLKNYPIIDIAILAFGFIIRVAYGGEVIDIEISRWLYLTILASAFYLGLGKRRNEILVSGTGSRKVNKLYPVAFLDKYMYLCAGLALVFYSLWATDPVSSPYLYLTIPLVLLLFMSYSLNIERQGTTGDPIEVLLGDRKLIIFSVLCATLTIYFLYA